IDAHDGATIDVTNPATGEVLASVAKVGAAETAQAIEAAEKANYSAIIIHGTGLGHLPIENSNGDAPENDELAGTIKHSAIPVIVANQCINGPVDLNVYSKGRNQQEIGVLGHGSTASPEALLAKVHWALSNGKDLAILSENLCGENESSLMT
ncbi:MAG: hypothetical protein ACPHA0_01490, partial [Candidatus Poseidoniaceae archaeon]